MPQYLKCLAAVPCDLSLITIYLFQAAAVFSPWFFLRYRRYINHLLTYLLNISQGTGSTVATRLRCGGILTYHPTASLPPSLTMKEFFFWKSVKKSHSSRHTIDSLLIRTLTVLLIGACVARLALSSITQPNSGRVALVAVRVTSCIPQNNNCLNPERISSNFTDRFSGRVMLYACASDQTDLWRWWWSFTSTLSRSST